ncbi:TMEM175 family protein [Croceiramulus getboli]|nr:TMEM175 family protein [Flavobacteriaceae bacterium YJPT1-3]
MAKITFSKDRVSSFSDAVFSIAMTLLVLEIDIPSVAEYREQGFSQVLANRIPGFIGLLVSFLVLAMYWVSHMRIFRYVKEVSSQLLWLNIFMLLFVVLLPFSTAFYVNFFNFSGPFIFYCLNLVVIGVLYFFFIRLVYREGLGSTGFYKSEYRWQQWRGLAVVIIWLAAALLATTSVVLSRGLFILLFVIHFILDYRYKKMMKKKALTE